MVFKPRLKYQVVFFGYPGTKKKKNGTLQLLYEAAPSSFAMELAGGMSITRNSRITDFVPSNVHKRVPCLMGSTEDIMEAKKYYENCKEYYENSKSRVTW